MQLTISWDGGICSKTFYDTVNISNLSATVDAGPDQTVELGQVVQLNATGGVDYTWTTDFPAKFSDPKDPQATSIPTNDTTLYIVDVFDEFGCRGLDSMYVYVLIPEREFVMNVITPNGDGKNDELDLGLITGDDFCSINIFDRWGREVYRTPVYNHNWNGGHYGRAASGRWNLLHRPEMWK